MLSSGAKCYADCSIQTDSESLAEARDAMESTGTISCASSVSLGVQPSTFEEKFTRPGTALCKIAYSHSQTSQTPINTLILRPRQERKQSSMTIGCGRPSSLTFSTRRITSLPTSASRDFLGRLDEPFRVASMPQRGKFGALQLSESQADGSDTIDIAYYSPDSTHDTGPHCETERAYPADLPQTPSPPSSPDSVMIIANEEQVSGSFLRRQSIDESGWITWASSPPRPIPALHGPSSLPYARCPSGAEGTITEGDDLSHKIWGLGIDDTQISNSRVNKLSGLQNVQQLNHPNGLFAMQPPTHEVIDYEIASFQNEKDAVIDLSKPSTFGHRANLNAGLAHAHLPHLAQQSRNVNIDILAGGEYNKPCSAVHNPQISKSSSNTMERDLGTNTFGLGLDWDLTAPAPSEVRNPGSSRNVDPGNRLNGAAPVFIPANNIDIERQKGMYMRPSSVTKPFVSQPHNREFAFNTVYQPLSHQDYHLPTPPSTASPLWSPIFSQPNDQTISEAHSQINTMYYLPKIYSPHLDPEDYASRLSEMVEQLSGHNLDHSIPRFSPIRHIPTKHAQLNAFQDQARKFVAHTKLPVPTKVDSINDSRQIPDPAETIDINDLLFSSERRRNISYQHPRSIPIARLIQRRLSSVVEEDACRDGLLPTFRKKVSELDFNRLSSDATPHLRKPGQWQTRYSSGKHLEYTKGDEKRLESAVSVENAQLYVENSGAIVKLPQKHVGSCPNQAVNNSGARKVSNFKGDGEKENLNDSGHTAGPGKQKNKHKKNPALSQV